MLTDAEINQRHKDRWAEAVAKYGDTFSVPREVVAEIQEKHRMDWVEQVAERDGKAVSPTTHTVVRSSAPKTNPHEKLIAFCDAMAGLEVDAVTLAGVAKCSETTARSFISDNRSRFAATGKRGMYTIVNVAEARAADKAS